MLSVNQPSLFTNNRVQLSEYSFANLYLFQKVHTYEVVQGLDLYVKGKTYDGFSFLMPTGPKSFQTLLNDPKAYSGVDLLFPIPEEWLQMVDIALWQPSYKDDDSDYLFDTLHLSHYDGRGLSKKRNLVKQFVDHYQAQEVPFDKNMALQLVEAWHQVQHEHSDAAECIDAIMNLEALKLDGTLYVVDSKPVGLFIGEALTADTYVLHFAKADISYKGIYQYMYQAFAKSIENRFAFINMEQDLGSPALRQAKHSYEPLRMCRKIRLRCKIKS